MLCLSKCILRVFPVSILYYERKLYDRQADDAMKMIYNRVVRKGIVKSSRRSENLQMAMLKHDIPNCYKNGYETLAGN